MKKSKIISFLRTYKVIILFWIAVIIGTVVAMNGLEWIYDQYFANGFSVTTKISSISINR